MNSRTDPFIADTYDNAGQLLTTTLKHGSTALDYFGYGYDAGGGRTSVQRTGNAYVNYGYDDLGQLVGAAGYEAGGAPRGNENFGYGYDGAGNLAYRTNNTLLQAFGSDNANELVNVTRNNVLTFGGNLTNSLAGLTVDGQSATIYGDGTFAVANGVVLSDGGNTFTTVLNTGSAMLTNLLTQTLPAVANLSYDLNGNLVSDGQYGYAHDCANELTQVTATNQWQVQYAYDGFGRRRIRREYEWVGGQWLKAGEVRYVDDGMRVLQERNALNTPVVTYTRGIDQSGSLEGAGGIGGLLARTDLKGSSYYHADGSGNVTMLIDSAGEQMAKYLYDPYGNILGMWGALAGGNAYRFSSKEADTRTGAYDYGYRYYQPNLQRWLNRDPIQELGGLNLYAYVGNNPVNLIDPLGLYDYSAAETQQQFLGPAFASATAGPIQGLFNIKNNSQGRGPYDFGWNQHANDTFCVNGKRLTADQFGNYMAGYQGSAYDQYVTSPFPALATVYADGVYYHITGDTKAVNDPFDTTGFPYIHMGAQGVPAPPPPPHQDWSWASGGGSF